MRHTRIQELAAEQHGVVAARQLMAAGMTRHAIAHRVSAGHLHVVYRGVYAVGHTALSERGGWMAAILAAGPGSYLTGEAGASLYRSLPWFPRRVEIIARRQVRGRVGFDARRVSALDPRTCTKRFGIPVASMARVLLDLAHDHDVEQVARVMHEAEFRRELSVPKVRALIRRSRGQRGVAVLRAALDLHLGGSSGTHSEFERRFLALVRGAGLPEPLVNVRRTIAGTRYRLDFHWPAARLVVETDGWASHSRARAREDDAKRDMDLVTDGWRVLRVTWGMLVHDPSLLVARLTTLLEQGNPATAANRGR